MSSLLAHLAFARIDRSRLLLTYLVGLAGGAILAVLVLATIGVLTI
jgi:hypothetical protein